MRLIVTRPAAQAAEWVSQLQAAGFDAASLPLIGIAPPDDPAAVGRAWAGLAQQQLVVFVSPNAAEQFFALRPDGAEWPVVTRAGSPGPGTSRALRDLGVAAALIVEPAANSAQFDSESLWAVLQGTVGPGTRVLIVRGDGGRDWLADTLRAHGASVTHVAAYRRQAPSVDAAGLALLQRAAQEPGAHLWLFSSSEAIDHLAALQPEADWRPARALGTHPRITARARQLGFGQVAESRPALDAVVACIQSLPTVNELPTSPPAADAPAVAMAAVAAPAAASQQSAALRWGGVALVVLLGGLTVASLVLAWRADQRVIHLEQELVRRQQESTGRSTEAQLLAKQAEEGVREAAAKVALLEARVAEVAVQRTQLEDLIQSLSRSRDENLLVDVDAAIRVALQQSAITGSPEPLIATLRQADERIARYEQPRLEGVRRAIARDLDRVKAASVADISSLSTRIDEAVRMVDDLPLLAVAELRKDAAMAAAAEAPRPASTAASSAGGGLHLDALWPSGLGAVWNSMAGRVWSEVKSLVRVTHIDRPEAMLLAPEQGFFLKENLKLRLLNARLALLSRQYDTAQADLQAARAAIDRYFDRGARRTQLVNELLKQVMAQARQVSVPRPDDTLAALATVSAGR